MQVLKSGPALTPIHYSYYVLRKIQSFEWAYINWTECDQYCLGHKYSNPVCIEVPSQREVAPEFCHKLPKAEIKKEICNTHCKFRWERAQRDEECSVTCGRGLRRIFYHCVLVHYESRQIVDDPYCENVIKPENVEECENLTCEIEHFQWISGEWSTVRIQIFPFVICFPSLKIKM